MKSVVPVRLSFWLALSMVMLIGLAWLPVEAGGAKKKVEVVTLTKGTIFTFEADKGEVTTLDILNLNPKGKAFQKIESYQVHATTKFILIDGAKKLVFNPKNVLTDGKAKTGFQKENAVLLEHKGNQALSVTFSPKKE